MERRRRIAKLSADKDSPGDKVRRRKVFALNGGGGGGELKGILLTDTEGGINTTNTGALLAEGVL